MHLRNIFAFCCKLSKIVAVRLDAGLMKISHFNDAYLSENLSRFVPQFVVILNQLFAEIQTKKTKPIAHHL
jgi:hypothetical protein